MLNKLLNLSRFWAFKYNPLIEVAVSKQAIINNLNFFRKEYVSLAFAPVLKSNAYGHGILPVAKVLDKMRLPFFVVDSFFEALVLRRAGIKTNILVIGYANLGQIEAGKRLANCSYTISNIEELWEISQNLKREVNFHLKIDTGMGRQGILPSQIRTALELIISNPGIKLIGVCSHLADADNEDETFTNKQAELWNKCVAIFKNKFPAIKFWHVLASTGLRHYKKFISNVCRLGLGLYGFSLFLNDHKHLQPALELKTSISSVKQIAAGAKVGYNITYTASQPTIIATVPVGYNEGVDRRLSNNGYFKIKDRFCPILGKVSMNITVIDVSNVANIQVGTPVTVISARPQDENSIMNFAKRCHTIPYEILVHIPSNLRRIVI